MKEKILNKAEEMFLEYGFKSVTMDDLANELGVSKKTIYESFANKLDLVQNVSIFIRDKIHQEIDEVISKNFDPIQEMFEIKKVIMRRMKNQKSSPQYQLQKYYPKVFANLKQSQVCKMEDCITHNIERGLAEKYYRNDINKVFVCRIYISGMLNLKDEELFKDSELTPKQLYEEFMKYHLRSIVDTKGKLRLSELEKQIEE
ncbi:TetR/AcrR family transcriptional regulator [Psychroflexus aestuariivivens]|uniref:TetR/AcrR family transcriptional regulator n=1 Tax=Psychroflexus aestuariivivens TaxID=1795040 RepID=UPI000FDAC79C|nr:TetR/AcrR family transcriptional regulator [Psychroflexus aestuariivivens]